ncbi:hypothetical protein ID851_14385 [Xenorhabdus sp. 5]|nr:hypothetical protein [Xenorhabdus sp. 5]
MRCHPVFPEPAANKVAPRPLPTAQATALTTCILAGKLTNKAGADTNAAMAVSGTRYGHT